jgi:hypothetical protein
MSLVIENTTGMGYCKIIWRYSGLIIKQGDELSWLKFYHDPPVLWTTYLFVNNFFTSPTKCTLYIFIYTLPSLSYIFRCIIHRPQGEPHIHGTENVHSNHLLMFFFQSTVARSWKCVCVFYSWTYRITQITIQWRTCKDKERRRERGTKWTGAKLN